MAAHLATGSDPSGSVVLHGDRTVSILELASSVEKPDVELVFLLLAGRANPNAVSPSGWSMVKALRTRNFDPNFKECLDSFFGSDCDVLLEQCRMMGRTGDRSPVELFDEADVASFLQNLRQEDLLHAAAILCDVVIICQLVCHHSAFDPNKEIEINGVLACPLSLVYYSSDKDSALCLKSLIVARADPHMPLVGGSSAGWTLAAAARNDQKHALVKILQKIPMIRNLAIAHPATAAKWIWSRIRRVEVTTAVVKSMVDYLVPCMYLDELVQEVLAIRAEPSEDEETFAVLYWRLATQLLCLSARYEDDKAVEQLLRASTDVESHDDSERCCIYTARTHSQVSDGLIARHRSALWHAASNGNEPLVQKLLAAGARFNRRDSRHASALHAACEEGHVRCAPWSESVSGPEASGLAAETSCEHVSHLLNPQVHGGVASSARRHQWRVRRGPLQHAPDGCLLPGRDGMREVAVGLGCTPQPG